MKSQFALKFAVVVLAGAFVLPIRATAQDVTVDTTPVVIQDNGSDTLALGSIPFTLQDDNRTTLGNLPMIANLFESAAPALNMRVSPNIRNESIRDAVKNLIGKLDVTYEIDEDVPADTKVSLKADNIQLTTAINALMESAGIGCITSRTSKTDSADGKPTTTAKVHFHFVKRHTGPIGSSGFALTYRNSDALANAFKLTDPALRTNIFDSTKSTADLLNKVYTSRSDGAPGLFYNLHASEERSTFTCPHCHQQVTIIKKHVAPKCPTCGRTFQDDWKFCPADGAKRPEDTGDWKFCPHCGKAITG